MLSVLATCAQECVFTLKGTLGHLSWKQCRDLNHYTLYGQKYVDTSPPYYFFNIPFQIEYAYVLLITSILLGRLSTVSIPAYPKDE